MDPPDVKSICLAIAEAEAAPGESTIHNEVIFKCMRYLLQYGSTRHLLCDEMLYPATTYYLIVFSFPGKRNEDILTINTMLRRDLSRCPKCVDAFSKSVMSVRVKFVVNRGIAVSNVNSYLRIIYAWQAAALEPILQQAVLRNSFNDPQVQNAVLESLMCSDILRHHPQVNTAVTAILLGGGFQLDKLTPGHVYFLFEGQDSVKKLVLSALKSLEDCSAHPALLYEISKHLWNIQDSLFFSVDHCITFWTNIGHLVACLSPESVVEINSPSDINPMSRHTDIQLFPLLRVLFNNLMASQNEPLPAILFAFGKLLSKLKQDFWTHCTPFVAINFLDPILLNPNYPKMLLNGISGFEQEFLIDWIEPYFDSIPQRHSSAVRVAVFLLSIAGRRNADDFSKLLAQKACRLLEGCFTSEPGDFKDPSYSVSILKNRDARAAIDNHAQLMLYSNDIALVEKCLSYDIVSLAHNSCILNSGRIPSSFDTFPLLWQHLSKLNIRSKPEYINAIFRSLKHVNTVINFTKKPSDRQLTQAYSQHKDNQMMIIQPLKSILEKISTFNPESLKELLTVKELLVGYWSCFFSPEISQLASNILYQVFDAAGRLEAIDSMLKFALPETLTAINTNLNTLSDISAFEPCPRAIRILMDIVGGLANPLDGVLTKRTDSKAEVAGLWRISWQFLVMVYKKTPSWATQYHLSELVEFTRDVLDVSHTLLDSFRLILDSLDGDHEQSHTLFKIFMDAFHHVIGWLRLGDSSLLSSCVLLVFKGFDLARDLKFVVDKGFIITFVQFGLKQKLSKLSEQQRLDIIAKAREFDSALVDEVASDVKKKVSKTSESPTPEPASFKYQTHQRPPQQQTLSRFGVVTKEAPVAPPVKQIKTSSLDEIRKELKSARAPVKPAAAPAPARPSGFNSKPVVAVGRSLNATRKKRPEESSEDEDEDVDISDLFVDKKKKAKVTEVGIDGKPLLKLAQSKKMNQQRKEEEYMRLRLNVSLKPLYTTILKWNYNATGDYPDGDSSMYKPTKETYTDSKDYVKTTEPLLMLECWQGIQSVKLTQEEVPFELCVGSRTTCDGFFDVYASIKKRDVSERKLGDNVLIVIGNLTLSSFHSAKEAGEFLKSPNTQTCLAKVREVKNVNDDFCDITFRVIPQGPMMGVLTPKSVLIGMKVMQMVTIEREYSSLRGLPYYDLCDDILSAKPAPPAQISDKEIERMLALYKVNKSQARAIAGSCSTDGFSLIQGPPGTGKTKTILGIVGYALSKAPGQNSVAVPGQEEGEMNSSKVLVCAPSNAAVDELVIRLRNGVQNSKGEHITPSVVRLGRSDVANAAVRDLTLEELLENQLQSRNNEAKVDPSIRTEHTKCIQLRNEYRSKLNSGDLSDKEVADLEMKMREVNKKRNELAKRLDEQRENASIAYRSREIERRKLQASILTKAQIICATLSGLAHDLLANLSMKFDQVIIDEACQCVELSAIIPLRYGCTKCIMVGDPNQLPPTVLSQAAASFNYEQSLFVRMQQNYPESVYLLDVQYRMHPQISKFPSAAFYNSRLKDGESMAKVNERPWHEIIGPYKFFDIVGRHQKNELSRSLFNMHEANVALQLVEMLMEILPDSKFKGRIGIISPYKEQIRVLKDVFRKRFGANVWNEIDFNTVDGFQGQEKEIIIMSCVRASETGNVGFLSDRRRMNVALTRARTSLWILGNAGSLRRNKVWNSLLDDAAERNSIIQAYPGFLRDLRTKSSREVSAKAIEELDDDDSVVEVDVPEIEMRRVEENEKNDETGKNEKSDTDKTDKTDKTEEKSDSKDKSSKKRREKDRRRKEERKRQQKEKKRKSPSEQQGDSLPPIPPPPPPVQSDAQNSHSEAPKRKSVDEKGPQLPPPPPPSKPEEPPKKRSSFDDGGPYSGPPVQKKRPSFGGSDRQKNINSGNLNSLPYSTKPRDDYYEPPKNGERTQSGNSNYQNQGQNSVQRPPAGPQAKRKPSSIFVPTKRKKLPKGPRPPQSN